MKTRLRRVVCLRWMLDVPWVWAAFELHLTSAKHTGNDNAFFAPPRRGDCGFRARAPRT